VNLRVLVVEDNDDWREIIHHQFQRHGCTVSIATSFSMAEQLLRDKTFDIVTLDMWLTDRERTLGNIAVSGGWRLLDRLSQQHPNTWVFVISAGFDDNPQRAFEQSKYGVKDFATKDNFEPKKIEEWIKLAGETKSSGESTEGRFPMI
jgi:CheY-like chemotaxis protein